MKADGGIVRVRYSLDDCETMIEVVARPTPGVDDQSNRFVAAFPLPRRRHATLTMAARITVNDTTYWDNNNGANYKTPVGASLKRIELSAPAESVQFSQIDVHV